MDKKSIWIFAVVISLVVPLVLVVGAGLLAGWRSGWSMMGPGMMGGWGYGAFGWIGMLLMWLIPLGLIVLVLAGAVWLVRQATSGGSGTPNSLSKSEQQLTPREILQIRYARSEITREQYLQMLEDLS